MNHLDINQIKQIIPIATRSFSSTTSRTTSRGSMPWGINAYHTARSSSRAISRRSR